MINKSKTYLLPLLSELVEFDLKFYKNIKNTYIYEDLGKYEKCIMILHDFSFKLPEFTHYEQKLINNELFIDLVDVGDQVLYIFKFPEDYSHEYEMFKLGKYSHFGEDAKELILGFFTNIYQHNLNAVEFLLKVKHILFKNERLRKKIELDLKVRLPVDAELSDIMSEECETFNLSKIIKTEKNKE
jgi:hypothetical protein|tara:strand:+ start:13557 stop:14114 length:558 start_codon:yes stop_codon:yes gene_type:complete